jgi:hypothetical protein
VVAGADPLNLTGGVLPVPRVPAVVGARVALRDGRAVGAIMSAHGRAQVFDNDHADAIVAALRRTTVKLAS